MFKKALIAAAIVMTGGPAFVSAQDFFFSFDEFSRVPTASVASGTATGSVFIFSDENLDFESLDINITTNGVARFTGATVLNSSVLGSPFNRFSIVAARDPNDFSAGPTPTGINLLAGSFGTPNDGPGPAGIIPANGPSGADADFRAGANGFLLARVDYAIIGDGTANFDFIADDFSVFDSCSSFVSAFCSSGEGQLDISFAGGAGELTVGEAVPEPSSAILLILGAAGMVARRRRS